MSVVPDSGSPSKLRETITPYGNDQVLIALAGALRRNSSIRMFTLSDRMLVLQGFSEHFSNVELVLLEPMDSAPGRGCAQRSNFSSNPPRLWVIVHRQCRKFSA